MQVSRGSDAISWSAALVESRHVAPGPQPARRARRAAHRGQRRARSSSLAAQSFRDEPGAGAVAGDDVFWVIAAYGVAIVVLGVISTGARARASAERVAALFEA